MRLRSRRSPRVGSKLLYSGEAVVQWPSGDTTAPPSERKSGAVALQLERDTKILSNHATKCDFLATVKLARRFATLKATETQ